MAAEDFPASFRDPAYAALDSANEQRLGIPVGILHAVRTEGERSNAGQVSSAGARTPYQIMPATRRAIMDQYGLDAYLSPQNASEAAGILLRDSLKRNDGDVESAVREYHGGTDPKNWGKQNDAYWQRVSAGMRDVATKAISGDFQKWIAANPTQGATPSINPASTPAPDAMAKGFANWLAGTDKIPETALPDRAPVSTAIMPPPPPPEPGLVDHAIGAGEAALATGTGLTTGTLGMIGGTLKGLAEQILSGQFGTPEAANLVSQAAQQGADAGTYSPRTQSGQDQTAAVNSVLQYALPAAMVLPTIGAAGALSRAPGPAGVIARAGIEGTARDAANVVARPAELAGLVAPGAAGDAAAGAAQAATSAVADTAANSAAKVASMARGASTLPRRALEKLGVVEPVEAAASPAPTPGTMGSVGAAATDSAAQRTALAADLPVPIALTKGQATRDPAQLKFEVETAKLPDVGGPLRERAIQTNQNILANMDAWIDQTGAEAPTLRATGMAVDKALVDRATRAKAEVNSLYAKASRSPEANAVVDPSAPVTVGEVEGAISSSPIDYLNAKASGLATTSLADAAKQYAVKLGIAVVGPDGSLVGKPTTIRKMEAWRREINQATGYEPTDIRDSTILKSLIDQQTEPAAGPLYRTARNARARYAQVFEDYGVISKLLNNKRGTADRQIAFEDVHKHSILDGSLDDVRKVRNVLQNAGEDGKQAWRELQGATLRNIRDEATKSVALDSAGNRVLSPAALDKSIRALDSEGKLDFIFGKKGAQQLRDIRELAQIARTVPPEAAINMSNTAMTLISGMGDIAGYGMSGVPMPIFTVGRMALKYIKDARLRNRISDALNELPPSKLAQQGPMHPRH